MYEKELPPIKALICIGNDHISNPIHEYIKRSGADKAIIATNAMQAMNEVYDEEFHFFLITQELPGEDGLDLYKRFKDKGLIKKSTRTIFLMENPSQDVVIKARKLGIENILIPPFTLQAISDRMKIIYASVLKKQQPKQPKGAALIAKNGHEAASLMQKAVKKKNGSVGMKIHAPHETADLILSDQKVIRKPRKATAILAKENAALLKPKKAVQKKKVAPVGKRPIDALPPYPGMTEGQRQKLMSMSA